MSRLPVFASALLLWVPFACAQQPSEPFKPNPPLPSINIKVGSAKPIVSAEIARTPLQIQTGMMFRKSLPDHSGMIFLLQGKERRHFWMANVTIPLSIAYLAADGTILEIHEMKPQDRNHTSSKSDKVAFALEMNGNWFDLHRVKPGERVTPFDMSWDEFLRSQGVQPSSH